MLSIIDRLDNIQGVNKKSDVQPAQNFSHNVLNPDNNVALNADKDIIQGDRKL